jgi:hypothetical protein
MCRVITIVSQRGHFWSFSSPKSNGMLPYSNTANALTFGITLRTLQPKLSKYKDTHNLFPEFVPYISFPLPLNT